MTQRIKLPARDPGVRVELGEHAGAIVEFRMRPVTMQIEEELDALQDESRRVEANPDSKPYDLCEAEVKQLDIILEPVATPAGDAPRTVPTVPSEILLGDVGDPDADPPREPRKGYVTGDVTRAQIRHTVERIVQAARPT
jgi:hypothetical protein